MILSNINKGQLILKLLYTGIACFITMNVHSQNIHYFNNRYDISGGEFTDFGWSILETDRGFIVAGDAKDYTINSYWHQKILIVDKNGIITDIKSLGDSIHETAFGHAGCIIQYDDTTFYSIGNKRKYTSNWVHDRGRLTCYNERLDTLWNSYYGEKAEPYDTAFILYQLKRTDDNNLIIVGGWKPLGEESRIWLAKTDPQGNLIWEYSYGSGNHYFTGYSVIQTSDGGYAVGGFVFDIGMNTSGDPLVIKTDSFGNEEWTMNLGGPYIDYIAMLCNSPDSHFVALTCYADSNFSTDMSFRRIQITKFDNNGNIIWNKRYGESRTWNYSFNIRPTHNGDFLACGRICTDFPHNSGWILRINNDGDSLWYRQYDNLIGEDSKNKIYDIIETLDHNIVGCGEVFPRPPDIGSRDTWIIRLDSIGCEYPFCDTTVVISEMAFADSDGFWVYPNPSQSFINFGLKHTSCRLQVAGLSRAKSRDCRFEIFDLFGRKVDEIVVPPLQETVRMDVSGWNTGVYVAVLWGKDGIVGREKFVVTR